MIDHDTKPVTDFNHFLALDMRAGTVVHVELLPKARRPAFILKIDFGNILGIKQSSAQITALYSPENLVGKQVLAVVNFPPRKIAGFTSEVLVCGFYNQDNEVVLVQPDTPVPNGSILG